MRRAAAKRARIAGFGALGVILALTGCASGGGAKGAKRAAAADAPSGVPAFDSATVVLWHFDGSSGVRIPNANGDELVGIAGIDTQPALGRYGGARHFTRSVDSFVWMASRPEIQLTQALTVEAWVNIDAFGRFEDTPIAGCWNPRTPDQSWFLAVGGQNLEPPFTNVASPGFHSGLLFGLSAGAQRGKLMFGFQPRQAGAPQAFFSSQPIELNRWTHVAVSFDGRIVRLFLNGRLDSQFAVSDEIRPSDAPLIVGNLIDARDFSSFGGELRILETADHNAYYAFEGSIDELRISNVARTEFPGVR